MKTGFEILSCVDKWGTKCSEWFTVTQLCHYCRIRTH